LSTPLFQNEIPHHEPGCCGITEKQIETVEKQKPLIILQEILFTSMHKQLDVKAKMHVSLRMSKFLSCTNY
jgi:hypothetical protein